MDINYHGLFFSLGAIITVFVYYHLVKLETEVSLSRALQDVFWVLLFGLIGARITYVLYYGMTLNFLNLVSFWKVGLVSFGGVISGGMCLIWLVRDRKKRGKWIDAFCISTVLGAATGRVGNYLQRDAFGVLNNSFDFFYGRVPIQLFESLYLLSIFFILLVVYKKKIYEGEMIWLALALYGAGRFVIDFYRDMADVWFGFNLSQLVDLIIFGYAIMVLWNKRTERTVT